VPFEQKKARAIALMDSKKMWRSNYAPPLLRILWRLGIRLPPLPFMPFWQVAVLTGGLWGTSWGCAMWFIYWGPSGMVAGEAIIRGLTLSGTKTHVKQRFLPLTPLLMVSDDLWSPVLPA